MHILPTLFILIAAWLPAHQGRNPDQQPRYQPDWPCVGRPDPSYVRVAEATGGQVFLFHPSELGESGALVLGAQEQETLFRAAATLDDGMHEYTIPVDATVESMRVSVSLQCLQITEIARPDGSLVQAADPSVEYHQFQAGRIVTVQQPAAGAWHVRVSGRGLFFLVVQGRTAVSLNSVEFVRLSGGPGHEGYFPTGRPPKAGVPQTLLIATRGRMADVRARVVTSAFRDLQPLTLQPVPSASDSQEFLAEITPPRNPFRVVISGIDDRGLPLQRVHPPLLETTR
jgi:hypothetical protein